jgi:glycosyltransferase involved in cell wall biosynthesis
MATAPALSVIMSVYNNAAHLYPCVQSILQQHFGDFEFLIVDDGSTDGSTEILRQLAADDARIRIFIRENKGLVASLNALVDAARAPLLARMDSDDIAMPQRFAMQIAYMAAYPDVGILGTNTHDLDEVGLLLPVPAIYPSSPADVRRLLEMGPPVCHPSVMMRTELIRDLGGYRAAFRHAEDYDLWLRAARVTQITSLPERLLLYRRSAQQISQKYAIPQAKAAAIAWLDYEHTRNGQSSLFDDCDDLPEIDELDHIFQREGASAFVRRRIVERTCYSNELLLGPAFHIMVDHVRGGGGFTGSLRTILRLGRKGRLVRAMILAMAVAGVFVTNS